jgi:uncharacterized protein
MPKPVPIPDQVSKPFWDACNEKRLVIQRCQQCKRYHHPPQPICPDCLSVDLVYEPVSGRGTINSYTITRDARQPAFIAIQPYVVAQIELEEQPELIMLSNLPSARHEDVKIGLPVEVEFEEIVPGRLIPQFRLARIVR